MLLKINQMKYYRKQRFYKQYCTIKKLFLNFQKEFFLITYSCPLVVCKTTAKYYSIQINHSTNDDILHFLFYKKKSAQWLICNKINKENIE